MVNVSKTPLLQRGQFDIPNLEYGIAVLSCTDPRDSFTLAAVERRGFELDAVCTFTTSKSCQIAHSARGFLFGGTFAAEAAVINKGRYNNNRQNTQQGQADD